MSLFTLTASATQTAMTNVTIKPKTITLFLSQIFKTLSCVLRRCKGTSVCAHRQEFKGKKAKKGGFIDTYQFLFVPLSPWK